MKLFCEIMIQWFVSGWKRDDVSNMMKMKFLTMFKSKNYGITEFVWLNHFLYIASALEDNFEKYRNFGSQVYKFKSKDGIM